MSRGTQQCLSAGSQGHRLACPGSSEPAVDVSSALTTGRGRLLGLLSFRDIIQTTVSSCFRDRFPPISPRSSSFCLIGSQGTYWNGSK